MRPDHSPQLLDPGAQRLEQIPPYEYLGWGKLPLLEGILREHEQQATMVNAGGGLVDVNLLEPVFSRGATS